MEAFSYDVVSVAVLFWMGVINLTRKPRYYTDEDLDRIAHEKIFGKPGSKRSRSGYSDPMGGCDANGQPLTVAFGENGNEGHTLLGDGDRSEINFKSHPNHNHYGSGSGPNNNAKDRGQYNGEGS